MSLKDKSKGNVKITDRMTTMHQGEKAAWVEVTRMEICRKKKIYIRRRMDRLLDVFELMRRCST